MNSESPSIKSGAVGWGWQKHAVRVLRVAGLLAIVGFVGSELWHRLSVLEWSEVQVSWPLVGLALLFSTVASGLPVVSMRFALRTFSARIPGWLPLAAATWLPALGKYVPGKVISIAGGFWMLRMLHVSTLAAGIAMFVLNGLSVLIGFLVSLPLAWWPPVRDQVPALGPVGMGLLAMGCVCLHPRVLGSVATFCLRKLKRPQLVYAPRWNDHVVPLIIITFQFILQGVTLWILSNAFESIPLAWLPAFVSINALALSVGFLALFAPGGIGVREGILLLVLTPATANAALIVIAMRSISLLGELILSSLGGAIFLSRIWKQACQNAASDPTSAEPSHPSDQDGRPSPASQAA